MRANRFFLIAAAALAAGACGFLEPSRGGPIGPRMEGTIEGVVSDESDRGVAGVDVRLFVAGREEARARSGADGAYRLDFSFDPASDETAVVWWITPRSDLASEFAILRESARDRGLGLWGPCVPRIGWDRSMTRSVQLIGGAERMRRIRESGCACELRRGTDLRGPAR